MIKLSQRAWNNVIIISMLMLILLFNFSSNFLNGGSDQIPTVRALVPSGAVITTVEYQEHKIERIGQGWRATSKDSDNATLSELIEHWHQSEITPIENDFKLSLSANNKTKVKLWFAGQALPTEYQFVPMQEKTFVVINKQTYELIRPDFPMLILTE